MRRSTLILRLLLLATTLFLTLATVHSRAAELLMFEEKWCHWCEKWNEEIGGIYDRTSEGKRAPLRRIDVHDAMPDDIDLKTRIQFTPTFVLVEDGKELERIEGYPGEDFFWALLGQMLEKLPEPQQRADADMLRTTN